MNDVIEVNGVKYRRLVEQPKYREVKRPAKVGERIRIVSPKWAIGYTKGDEFTVRESTQGDVVKSDHVKVKDLGTAILNEEYVVLEPVEDEAKPEPLKFSVGDYARVVNYGWFSLRNGDIVKITHVHTKNRPEPYRVERFDGAYSVTRPDQLEPATQAEYDEFVRKETERRKWAEIGRKPGEFKVGDIVNPFCCHDSRKGFGYVEDVAGDFLGVRTAEGGDYYESRKSDAKLICPVEKRFDNVIDKE